MIINTLGFSGTTSSGTTNSATSNKTVGKEYEIKQRSRLGEPASYDNGWK